MRFIRKLLLIIPILLLPSLARAQGVTTVTGTVKDSAGNLYAGGRGNAIFVPGTGGQPSTITGTNVRFPTIVTLGTISATGVFTAIVTDNTQVTPTGSQWIFNICDSTSTFCFSTAAITVSGSSQDISSNIASVVLSIPRRAGTVMYVGADVTNSTVTPAAVTGLSFPVAAGQSYTMSCELTYQAAATGGLVVSFTGPASPTLVEYTLLEATSVSAVNNSATTGSTFATTLGVVVVTAATNFPVALQFALENGANAGTVQLMFQSAAAVATTIKRGSFCTIQ